MDKAKVVCIKDGVEIENYTSIKRFLDLGCELMVFDLTEEKVEECHTYHR